MFNAGERQVDPSTGQYGAVLDQSSKRKLMLRTPSINLQFDKLQWPVAHARECAMEYFALMSIEPYRVTDVRTIFIYIHTYIHTHVHTIRAQPHRLCGARSGSPQ